MSRILKKKIFRKPTWCRSCLWPAEHPFGLGEHLHNNSPCNNPTLFGQQKNILPKYREYYFVINWNYMNRKRKSLNMYVHKSTLIWYISFSMSAQWVRKFEKIPEKYFKKSVKFIHSFNLPFLAWTFFHFLAHFINKTGGKLKKTTIINWNNNLLSLTYQNLTSIIRSTTKIPPRQSSTKVGFHHVITWLVLVLL